MKHSTYNCAHCNTENNYRGVQYANKFCNNTCSAAYQTAKRKAEWYAGIGNDPVRGAIKRYVIEDRGYVCQHCGVNEWNGKYLPLELDHIDGNAGNNHPDNVRLLCPNCHAITPTWKGKNKGNGRASRGLPLY